MSPLSPAEGGLGPWPRSFPPKGTTTKYTRTGTRSIPQRTRANVLGAQGFTDPLERQGQVDLASFYNPPVGRFRARRKADLGSAVGRVPANPGRCLAPKAEGGLGPWPSAEFVLPAPQVRLRRNAARRARGDTKNEVNNKRSGKTSGFTTSTPLDVVNKRKRPTPRFPCILRAADKCQMSDSTVNPLRGKCQMSDSTVNPLRGILGSRESVHKTSSAFSTP